MSVKTAVDIVMMMNVFELLSFNKAGRREEEPMSHLNMLWWEWSGDAKDVPEKSDLIAVLHGANNWRCAFTYACRQEVRYISAWRQ